jgi:quercetin dioxygenase-like cupin family protein
MTVETMTGYALGPDEGDARWYCGCLMLWKAVGEQTNGAFSLMDVIIRKGVEPPVHVHSREDELFYVLEGEMVFQIGDEVYDAPAGSSVFGPRGVPHGWALKTDVARALILVAPAGIERSFFEFSEPARERTLPPEPYAMPDFGRVEAWDAELGITYLGPPLSVEVASAAAGKGGAGHAGA